MGLIVDSSVFIAGERQRLSARAAIDSLVRQFADDQLVARQQFLDDLLVFVPIIPVDAAIARRAGRIDADLMSDGSRIGWIPTLKVQRFS